MSAWRRSFSTLHDDERRIIGVSIVDDYWSSFDATADSLEGSGIRGHGSRAVIGGVGDEVRMLRRFRDRGRERQ